MRRGTWQRTIALKGMNKYFHVRCERAWHWFGSFKKQPYRPDYGDFCKMYMMGGEL